MNEKKRRNNQIDKKAKKAFTVNEPLCIIVTTNTRTTQLVINSYSNTNPTIPKRKARDDAAETVKQK